jgi:hypothetical protein
MREIPGGELGGPSEAGSLTACLATILEIDLDQVPRVPPGEELPGWRLTRWLGGRGLGLAAVAAVEGTFPSGLPGSALSQIEAEVCESFDPPLAPSEHRRKVVTRGIDLNRLVGHAFAIGSVRCRGARLCEPCSVVDRYASRPVLRALVHRGGLRADILEDGVVRVGDEVRGGPATAGVAQTS